MVDNISLVDKGIVSQQEYEIKVSKIKKENKEKVVKIAVTPLLTQEQKDMLDKLQNFVLRGILTAEEFEQKKDKIYKEAAEANKSVQVPKLLNPQKAPSSPVFGSEPSNAEEYTQRMEELKSMINESQKQQLKTLDRFLNQKFIQREEYEKRKKTILGSLYFPTNWEFREVEMIKEQVQTQPSPRRSDTSSVELTPEQKERIEKLEKLRDKQILSEEMFKARRQQIIDEGKQVEDKDEFGNLTSDQRNKIAKLKHGKKMGIVTSHEYVQKIKEIIGGNEETNNTTQQVKPPKPQARPPKPTAKPPVPSKPPTPSIPSSDNKPKKAVPPPLPPTKTPSPKDESPVVDTNPQVISQPSTSETPEEIQDQIERLESLVEMGVITGEDFEQKKQKLLSAATPESTTPVITTPTIETKPSEPIVPTNNNQQVKQLEKLYNAGIITKEDYEQKAAKILNGSDQPVVENKTLSPNVESELSKLKKLLESGIITEEQYKLKESKLLQGGSAEQGSSPIQRLKSEENLMKKVGSGDLVALEEGQLEELEQLRSFLNDGLIDEQDYEEEKERILKRIPSDRNIVSTPSSDTMEDASSLGISSEKQEQINKLKQFLQEGLIDQTEYEEEVQQVLSNPSSE